MTAGNCVAAEAVLALWNDIEPERIDEYERWHTLEHVPERVAAPGFMAGSRYVSVASGIPRYFTLYELESLDSVQTPQYRCLVDEPTPWSASMRPAFRRFLRKPCRLRLDRGNGVGAGLLVVRAVDRFGSAVKPALQRLQELADALLDFERPDGVNRVQVGLATPAGIQALADEDDAPVGMEHLYLVQTAAPERLDALRRRFQVLAGDLLGEGRWARFMAYRLASRVLHAEVAHHRRPGLETSPYKERS